MADEASQILPFRAYGCRIFGGTDTLVIIRQKVSVMQQIARMFVRDFRCN
jgi:hypothetical protein